MTENTDFKSGFVSIIGCPNVGKSTLLNSIIGQKVAIVSDKPQTTRTNIRGVYTNENSQIVFIDTPGLQTPRNKLGEFMEQETKQASDMVDAIIVMIDGTRKLGEKDKNVLRNLENSTIPIIVVVNKIDAITEEHLLPLLQSLQEFHFVQHVIPISASQGTNVDELLDILLGLIKEGPMYFDNDMITDQPERVLIAEFIREKALRLLQEEIPHGVGVEVQKMERRERDGLYEIYATIYCERQNHKAIIIGKQGKLLKQIGEQARADIEFLIDAKVYLNLWVKVQEGWRNNSKFMRGLGYE